MNVREKTNSEYFKSFKIKSGDFEGQDQVLINIYILD
jgi:hypothetical protein